MTGIPLPTLVVIKANNIPEAWALAVHACSQYGSASSSDYKNTPTIRMNMKLIIDKPMGGFYHPDGSVSERVLHSMLRASASETGILTQGVKGLYAYISNMSREYARKWMNTPAEYREQYCYPARLMYYPATDRKANELLESIRLIALNKLRLDESIVVRSIYDLAKSNCDENRYIDQLEHIKNELPKREGSRRLKAQLWIPEDDLLAFENQPCFQDIYFEYLGNGNVHLELNFRSWDLFNGLPFNIPGILNLVYKEVLEPNDMSVSRLTCNGRDTHIYQANLDDAKKIFVMAEDRRKIVSF